LPIIYLTIEQAMDVHRKTVEKSGGGSIGALDANRLASVLAHIQNDDYYPTLEDKLTHLFFCTNKFHCFEDGNKRLAITLCAQFLLNNGYLYAVQPFLYEMENISYHVATGSIGKELLKEIIAAILTADEGNEELKLKILHAINPKNQDD
jgi:death-on-curing protein